MKKHLSMESAWPLGALTTCMSLSNGVARRISPSLTVSQEPSTQWEPTTLISLCFGVLLVRLEFGFERSDLGEEYKSISGNIEMSRGS